MDAAEVSDSLGPLEVRLGAAWPPGQWCEVTVLLAVSGGPDSVALLRTMNAQRGCGAGRLAVAHFDHRLRGPESEADARFVERLCGHLGVECLLGSASAEGTKTDTAEQAARNARYEFLRLSAERLGARYVVTAHTADDQAETILHHVLRGTGLWGLAGMQRARKLGPATTLIRPLLGFRRWELLAYLDEIGQQYRTDATNLDRRYTRNRIRHELLPLLGENYNGRIIDALCRLGGLAGDAQEVIGQLAGELAQRCVLHGEADRMEIDVAVLAVEHRHLIRETLIALWRDQRWPQQAMTFTEWDLLAGMVLADPTGQPVADREFPGGVLASRQGSCLQLTRRR